MTVTQLAELILARLYDYAKSKGFGEEFDVEAIAREFGETDSGKIYNAAKVLESRGWINPHFSWTGGVYALLTGEGAVAVEQGTALIREFRRNPQRFLVVDQSTHYHGSISATNMAINSQVGSQSVSSSPLSPAVNEILERIYRELKQNAELAEAHRQELLNDVETLRSELQKAKPRGGIIREVLSTFGDVASISGLVMQLQQSLSFLKLF